LARDLGTVTLADLAATLNLDPTPGGGWPAAAQTAADAIAGALERQMSRTLAEVFSAGEEHSD
jgi:hypothetical protein